MNNVGIILMSVTFAAVGQVSWKVGMDFIGPVTDLRPSDFISIFLDPYVFFGLIMYGLGTIFWLIALSRMELSFLYPFISLTYILVLALSYLVLKESIGLNKMVGTVLIISGLLLISRFN
jgi:drug/metabolite transporter (DMT)-like permease